MANNYTYYTTTEKPPEGWFELVYYYLLRRMVAARSTTCQEQIETEKGQSGSKDVQVCSLHAQHEGFRRGFHGRKVLCSMWFRYGFA